MTLGKVTSLPSLMIFAQILIRDQTTDYCVAQYSVLCVPLWIPCLFDQSKHFGMEIFQTHGTLEQSLEFLQLQLRHLIWVLCALQKVQNTC